jgi:hypothetical protein
MPWRRSIAVALVIAAAPFERAASASLPDGRKTVALVAADGTKLPIGHVTFTGDASGASIEVKLDSPEFGDEFLSMRPFRCLPGPKEMWCHLEYPYANRKRVSANDLTDLEYALLFLFKPPTGFGIDAWNGLYFKMTLGEAGAIDGVLHEADYNVLAVPPEASNLRPIGALTPMTAPAHRFVGVEIR